MDPKEILKKVEVKKKSTKLLRDHIDDLVSQRKTEGKILHLDQETKDLTVIQRLQLWDKISTETFQEYNRLLSRLTNTKECLCVLKIWEDNLHHINQFLDSILPQYYHELSEQNKLCQAHHDVVSCQKNAIDNYKPVDSLITEKLNSLTNIHNEILAKIMEKQDEIRNRLMAWDNYRKDQSKLMKWLNDTENVRNKLNLDYISANLLVTTIESLKSMLHNFFEAEELNNSLQRQLNDALIKTCDENFISPLKFEQTSLSNRLDNFKAGLKTWLDTLLRMKDNLDKCENEIKKIFFKLEEIQNRLLSEIQEGHNIPYDKLEIQLSVIEESSKVVNELAVDIANVDKIKNLLKNNLNPSDIKDISHRCWLLSQQRWDIEYQISSAKETIDDQIQKTQLYDERFERFLTWVLGVDQRLDRMSSQGFIDAGQALRRLETEIQSEVIIKTKEVDWLSMTGRELLSVENDGSSQSEHLTQTLEVISKAWKNILLNTNGKSTKLRNIIQKISELNIQMEDLRKWFLSVECRLSIPIKFTSASQDIYDNLIQTHEVIHNEIEEHREKVSDVLNLCDILSNDCDSCQIALDTQGIMMAMAKTEKRWSDICVYSTERRNDVENLWKEIQYIYNVVDKRQEWIGNMILKVKILQSHLELCSIENIFQTNKSLKDIDRDIESNLNRVSLKNLKERYRIPLKKYSLPTDILGMLEKAILAETDLKLTVKNLNKTACSRVKSYDWFVIAHDNALTIVFKCDAMLKMVEIKDEAEINEINTPEALAEHLSAIQKIIAEKKSQLDEADEAGIEVINWCNEKDAGKIQSMMDDYRLIYKDIKERLASLIGSNILTKKMADQSLELSTKFETNMGTQIVMVERNDFMRKDAFIAYLNSSIDKLEIFLTQLRDIEKFDTYQAIDDCICKCDLGFGYVKYLSEVLLDEYNVDKTDAQAEKVKNIHGRFTSLREQAEKKINSLRQASATGKLICPLCSNNSWQQLENELWRLEQWIEYTVKHLFSREDSSPLPLIILEDIMQDQRKLLLDMERYKSVMISMNAVGAHLAEHSGSEEKAKQLRERILNDNTRWDTICKFTAEWMLKLETELIQNSEFHNKIDELIAWIDSVDVSIKQSEPINFNDPAHLLQAKLDKFKKLGKMLERFENQILSLEEVTTLISQDTEPSCQRLTRLRLKYQSLAGLTSVYLTRLSSVQPSNLKLCLKTGTDERSTNNETMWRRKMRKVINTSIPLNFFLLLVLGAAFLIPPALVDNSCAWDNYWFNMRPILSYPHGPRPT